MISDLCRFMEALRKSFTKAVRFLKAGRRDVQRAQTSRRLSAAILIAKIGRPTAQLPKLGLPRVLRVVLATRRQYGSESCTECSEFLSPAICVSKEKFKHRCCH